MACCSTAAGSPGFAGDIAIQGGKIAAIGRIDAAAARVISASDLVVTPGFIDIHRHADAAVFRPDFGQLELHQGLTTIVNGNCGLSLAPVSPAHKAEILGYMSPITGRVPSHIETATMDGYLEQVGRAAAPHQCRDARRRRDAAGQRRGLRDGAAGDVPLR